MRTIIEWRDRGFPSVTLTSESEVDKAVLLALRDGRRFEVSVIEGYDSDSNRYIKLATLTRIEPPKDAVPVDPCATVEPWPVTP